MAVRPTSIQNLNFTPEQKPFPSPRDWRDIFIYQLLIDRFDDTKDHPAYDPRNVPRGRDKAEACLFQGGNIKGIARRLDYIKSLGCNSISISPPLQKRN